MRSLATALGCLVIASYATVGTATTGYDDEIVASCHFGDNGYVIFRQKAGEEIHEKKPAQKGRKRMLPQLVGPAALDQEEEEGGDDAEEQENTPDVEGAKKIVQHDSEDESEQEDECEQLSADGSAHEDEQT